MTRLHTEYQRLYLPPGVGVDDTAPPRFIDSDGRTRTMVLALGHPADWATLSPVWRGVQADLALPAPAIAVNGVDAFELWFSLAQPVSVAEAAAFLQGLRQRYLPELAHKRLRTLPAGAGDAPAAPPAAWIPALQAATGQWSAFVAPDLAAVFGDDPSLDFQPGNDAQAELLSRLASIPLDGFQTALALLRPVAPPAATTAAPASSAAAPPPATPGATHAALAGPYQDPQRFLLDVMNDPTVALSLRIEAAKALLPHGAPGAPAGTA